MNSTDDYEFFDADFSAIDSEYVPSEYESTSETDSSVAIDDRIASLSLTKPSRKKNETFGKSLLALYLDFSTMSQAISKLYERPSLSLTFLNLPSQHCKAKLNFKTVKLAKGY